MNEAIDQPKPLLGWLGFATGALALVAAVSLFWAGPFAPQQEAGVSLGELAADIVKSAARDVAGLEQPEPVAPERDIDDYLAIGTGALGALAVILGVGGMVRHERMRPAVGGAALGGVAIAFQFFAFYAMALLGVLLVMALIHSLKDALGDVFGGLFG